MKRLHFDSVKANIICLLVASAVLSVAIFVGFTYRNITAQLHQTVDSTYVAGVNSTGSQLEQGFSELNQTAAKLTCMGGMTDQVKEMLTTQDITQYNTLHAQLLRQLVLDDYSSPLIGRVDFYFPGDPANVFLSNYSFRTLTPQTEALFYQKHPYTEFNMPRPSTVGDGLALSLTRYAGNSEQGVYYLYIETDPDYLSSLFSPIASLAGGTVSLCLTDADGIISYCQGSLFQPGEQYSPSETEKKNICFSYAAAQWNLHLAVPKAEYHKTGHVLMQQFLLVVLLFTVVYVLLAVLLYRAAYGPLDRFIRELSHSDASDIYRQSLRRPREFDMAATKVETMRTRICELLTQVEMESRQKAHLENQLLISRINPHFLHNTLNRISVTAANSGNEGLSETITALNSLLYYNLGKNKAATLRDEIRAADDYVCLSQSIAPFTYRKDIQVPEAMLEIGMPTFILQPLIENCIKHNADKSDLQITLRVFQRGGVLHLEISDNGRGIDAAQQMVLNEKIRAASMRDMSIGLGYVSAALTYAFGSQVRFQVENKSQGGVLCSIRIQL